jgi:hypothetical protein
MSEIFPGWGSELVDYRGYVDTGEELTPARPPESADWPATTTDPFSACESLSPDPDVGSQVDPLAGFYWCEMPGDRGQL